jgi:hypothetical protein
MSVEFSNNLTKRQYVWSQFKIHLSTRNGVLQCEKFSDHYMIWFYDGPEVFICNIWDGPVPYDISLQWNLTQQQNDYDKTEFEQYYLDRCNLSISKLDNKSRSIIVPEPRIGNEVIYTTHNFCDKVTWFSTSERINDEVLTSNDGYIWKSVNTYWIDMISGRVQDDDGWVEQQRQLNPSDPHGYQVIVKVDGIEKTMREPFMGDGGDYEVFWEDGYIKSFEDWTGKIVTASYSKAIDSTFILSPLPGTILNIEAAEADFTKDVEMCDSIEYAIYGYANIFAPELGLPEGTKIPLKRTVYKRLSQIFNEAIGSYPLVEIYGSNPYHNAMNNKDRRKVSRGISSYLQSIPFRYSTIRALQSSLGLEVRIKLTHNIEFKGDLAVCTFYCTSEPEI